MDETNLNNKSRKNDWADALSSIAPPVKKDLPPTNSDALPKTTNSNSNNNQEEKSTYFYSGYKNAGILARSAAYIYDGIILLIITLPFRPDLSIASISPSPTSSMGIPDLTLIISKIVSFAIFQFIVWAIYNIAFEAIYSSTPGKYITGLKVIDKDGKKPLFYITLLRFLTSGLSWITMNIGHAMVHYRADRLSLHDIMSSTRVVEDKNSSIFNLPPPPEKLVILATPLAFTISLLGFTYMVTQLFIAIAKTVSSY